MSLGTRILYRGKPVILASVSPIAKKSLPFLNGRQIGSASVAAQAAYGHSGRSSASCAHHNDGQVTESCSGTELLNSSLPTSSKAVKSFDADFSTELIPPPSKSTVKPVTSAQNEVNRIREQLIKSTATKGKTNEDEAGVPNPVRYIRHSSQSKVARTWEEHQARKRHNMMVKHNYQEKVRQEKQAPLTDWRIILRDLEIHTPKRSAQWHNHALRILVPAKAVGKLLYSMDDNIWDIKTRTGCQVELSDADTSGYHRAILISGPSSNISKAAAEVLRIAPEAVRESSTWQRYSPNFNTEAPLHRPTLDLESDMPPNVRYVRAERRALLAKVRRLDQVERPQKWTPATFGLYVQSLTSVKKMTAHIGTFIYQPTEDPHVKTVLSMLTDLFFDPDVVDAISVTAFNDAITYFYKAGQIAGVRQLFVRMEMLNLPLNTETFNIMLRGCSKGNDLKNFQFILGLMRRRSYIPDSGTWLAFIQTLQTLEIKQYVVASMKEKELFHDPGLQKQVLEQFVTNDITQSLAKGMTLSEFLEDMSLRYSEDWLILGSANRILYVLANHGLISRCWEFVQYMHSQGIAPNLLSYIAILAPCRRQQNIEGALEILNQMSSLEVPLFDDNIYDILFDMAWRARLSNVSRVIWRYACLERATSYKMRKRMKQASQAGEKATRLQASVSDAVMDEEHSHGWRWKVHLGVSILDKPRTSGSTSKSHGTFIPVLQTKSKTHEAFRNPSDDPLRDQLSQGQHWIPLRPLTDVLLEAWAADQDFGGWEVRGPHGDEAQRLLEKQPVKIALGHRTRIHDDGTLMNDTEKVAWW